MGYTIPGFDDELPELPEDIRPWCAEVCDGSPQAQRELSAVIEAGRAGEWLDDVAVWAGETDAPGLTLERFRAGLKAGGMAPAVSVAVVAEIRQRMRSQFEVARYLARRDAHAHRSPPAQCRLASLALQSLRARADAHRLVERGGYIHAPVDMARAVFAGLGVDDAELGRWRDAGLLRCEPGGLTARIRLGHYGRRHHYALRADLDTGAGRAAE